MVKVWYTPPPYGPGTSLNRPGYGLGGPAWVRQLSKMPQVPVIAGAIGIVGCLAYIPIAMHEKLPHTMSPEYEAATRAYMRYHNMNPIWGISSKEAREADGH
uniref:Uncharacterized protein n=1 Tax=Trieres chinensis TaxID=1514140 RepID=A0A7S2A688_TRICV|mmetsp:Transcript_4563/g.9642  ORF Transcript_4563/g.9642 Transcript_4563/m.9642 type:complete len:102 (+) Transcript_4563:123-428(+)|eukprot:CAMPEP_0183291972 /NCGR_PEP_ID=MMETSP0160_2-20130417/1211_1 /TAXON_ID=2839 ORGANISM="Odontella Sinensis, Strain Grunow 1884" /NCGR_SAMPLE_ID=MMETSP0160_2 /ASSEMBLY_ACC=CAM_ASM_000250 /LENGTH=101 /DNA_ID=CAMNT_0025452861 /DNA_START=97 /DNA_END=402 /DNA_ORIENTATION=+